MDKVWCKLQRFCKDKFCTDYEQCVMTEKAVYEYFKSRSTYHNPITINPIHIEPIKPNKYLAVKKKVKSKNVPKYSFTKRALIWMKTGGICYICGTPVKPNKFTYDHFIPKFKKGSNSYENLFATHSKCNHAKGTTIYSEKLAEMFIVIKS